MPKLLVVEKFCFDKPTTSYFLSCTSHVHHQLECQEDPIIGFFVHKSTIFSLIIFQSCFLLCRYSIKSRRIITDNFRCHPIRCPNKSISPPDGSVQLCTDTKIYQFHFSIVSQQHILAFNVTMNHLAGMQMRQASKHFPEKTKKT